MAGSSQAVHTVKKARPQMSKRKCMRPIGIEPVDITLSLGNHLYLQWWSQEPVPLSHMGNRRNQRQLHLWSWCREQAISASQLQSYSAELSRGLVKLEHASHRRYEDANGMCRPSLTRYVPCTMAHLNASQARPKHQDLSRSCPTCQQCPAGSQNVSTRAPPGLVTGSATL